MKIATLWEHGNSRKIRRCTSKTIFIFITHRIASRLGRTNAKKKYQRPQRRRHWFRNNLWHYPSAIDHCTILCINKLFSRIIKVQQSSLVIRQRTHTLVFGLNTIVFVWAVTQNTNSNNQIIYNGVQSYYIISQNTNSRLKKNVQQKL